MTVTKGFMVTLSGESIEDMILKDLKLPEDAKLFKVVPTSEPFNGFNFLFLSEKGFEIDEAANFPRVGSKTDLPDEEKAQDYLPEAKVAQEDLPKGEKK